MNERTDQRGEFYSQVRTLSKVTEPDKLTRLLRAESNKVNRLVKENERLRMERQILSEWKLTEYQGNIPYLEDLNLFHATRKAIYIIVMKHGRKNETIKRVAKKDKVKEEELRQCVDTAIPVSFFAERSEKAKNRHEQSFYKAPDVSIIPESEKAMGYEKLKEIRKLLGG